MLNSLSVFFPCLNDAKSIPDLLGKTYRILPQITSDYEVIVIDDGSTDNTAQVLKELQKKYKNLRTIRNSSPSGYGGALKTGFEAVKKEWVFYTDGDGQYDPTELIKLAGELKTNIDVVNGYQIKRGDTFLRKIIGKIYNLTLQILYPLPIRDVDCDFRLIRKKNLSRIKLNSSSGAICLELVMKLRKEGARFSEVGVHHYARKHGKSAFFKLPNIASTFVDNLKLLRELS